jgi:hypothetical protein
LQQLCRADLWRSRYAKEDDHANENGRCSRKPNSIPNATYPKGKVIRLV